MLLPPHYLMSAERIERTGTEYLLQARGDCMRGAGIRDGDIVGIRSQTTAEDGEIVVAVVPGGKVLRTYRYRDNHYWLESESPDHEPILADDVTITGVLTAVISWMHR
jgi:repressor LexA